MKQAIAIVSVMMAAAPFLSNTPALASTGGHFRCYSKYYTANQVTLSISGNVESDTRVSDLKVLDEADGLKANLDEVDADPSYHPRTYVGYNLYNVDNNEGSKLQSGIQILLPDNLSTLSRRFTAFASDAAADNDGSNGYFKVLCSMTR